MIEWQSYSKESFKKAESENKPVFFHIFAPWCSFCKKMSQEILEDPEIIEKINKDFVPIMVNREDRPDIDSIYQKASYIIGQGSGWPLNLLLNFDGKPFAGISYKPKEGKDYFITMLDKSLELFKINGEQISKRTQVIIDAIKPLVIAPSEIREDLLHNPDEDIVQEIDFDNGGFKKTPKFPPFSHIDLLLWRYWIRPKPWVSNAIEKTLKGMLRGAIYDHVEGGFHRYCTDNEWKIPHFEKLAIDNAWHVIGYLDAYCILKDGFYREIAEETIDYMRKNLLSEEGFFYASQFADSFYYTWDEKELNDISDMTIALVDNKAITDGRFILVGRDRELIKQLREKLLAKRKEKISPEIDRKLYACVNGICCEAFVRAWRVLKNPELLEIAIRALDKSLSTLLSEQGLFRALEEVPALIDDYAYIISALISLYEVTAERKYIEKALTIMELALENLWDDYNGGFYESPEEILSIRQKNIHDTPYPSANSMMIINLLKLNAIFREEKFLNLAKLSLKAFSNTVSPYLSPYYIKALLTYFDLLTLNFYASLESNMGRAVVHQITPFTVIAHRDKVGDYVIPTLAEKEFEPLKSPEDLAKFLRF